MKNKMLHKKTDKRRYHHEPLRNQSDLFFACGAVCCIDQITDLEGFEESDRKISDKCRCLSVRDQGLLSKCF